MMDLTGADGPILVAPRPLRISSAPAPFGTAPFYRTPPTRLVGLPQAIDGLERMSLAEDATGSLSPTLSEKSQDGSASARSASRPSIEAIEEFLAILKPSFHATFTGPFGVPRRSVTVASGMIERSPSRFSPRVAPALEEDESVADADKENVLIIPRARGPYGPLGSPVSRTHTRNPFFRHPSYDVTPSTVMQEGAFGRVDLDGNPASGMFRIDSPSPAPSPAAVPLPSPTPEEMQL